MEGTKKRREFIKDRIYEDVRHDIITFRYQPGEKLSEYSLAEKFGVSRSPVRSVLQKLRKPGGDRSAAGHVCHQAGL